MSNHNNVVRSGLWYTVSTIIVKGTVFISTPFFTRILSKTEYGDYNNYLSWVSIAIILVTLNFDSTMISARYDYEKEYDNYCLTVFLYSLISCVIWLIVLHTFQTQFEKITGISKGFIYPIVIYLAFYGAIEIFLARCRILFEYKQVAIINIAIAVLSVGLAIILSAFLQDKLWAIVLGQIIPNIAVGTIICGIIIKKANRVIRGAWRYALPICLPFIPHLLSMILLNAMDRIMIKKICGAEDTALYSVAYTCGYAVAVFMISMNTAFCPWLGERINNKEYKEIRRFSYKYITLFIYLLIGVLLVSPEMLMVLGGKKYMCAKNVIPPVAVGVAFQFLYTMFVNVEQITKKTWGMAFASISAAILNFCLNRALIPAFGYEIAAYTTLLSYLWLLIVHMLFVVKIKYSFIYDYKFMVCVVVGLILIMIGLSVLYNNTILRWIIVAGYILLLLTLCVINRNKIMKMFVSENREG